MNWIKKFDFYTNLAYKIKKTPPNKFSDLSRITKIPTSIFNLMKTLIAKKLYQNAIENT